MRRVELPGATVFVSGRCSLLVDCPEGTAAAWMAAGLPAMGPTAICFTSGSWRAIAGLYGLLGEYGHERALPLRLMVDMRSQQVEILAGAFCQSEGAQLSIEADWPGATLTVGPITLRSQDQDQNLTWVVDGFEVRPR